MVENTFLGLQPYTEADAYRFKGRTEESQELFRLIVRNDYTVCYAESGEGKTSLLNAGVFPLLRQNMFFPIAITFTSDDYEHTPESFDAIIDRCIRDSITEYNENNKGINIEYKLCSTDFQDTDRQLALQQELSKYSWWKLRNYKPQAMGLTFKPVFVFDQFEEIFNLPGSIVWTKKFFDWLEDVSSDSCPDEIINKVREIIGINAAFPAIKEEKDFKAVFSLRKEFIGELDYWGMQKCFIPSLKDNRYCLKALTYEGAKKVMTQQERFEETKVEQVLRYFVQQYSREPEKTISENLPVIPALLLSVVCDSWEKDINYFSDIDTNGIDESLNKILEKFYDEALSTIVDELFKQETNSQAGSIRNDIETAIFALVDSNGKRVRRKSSELSHLDFDAKYKEILSDKRIIKISKVDGEDYVEVVHDALCPIIAKRKEQRLAEEAKKREEERLREQTHKMRKRMLFLSGVILLIFAFFGIAVLILSQRDTISQREKELEMKSIELEAKNEQLEESQSVLIAKEAKTQIEKGNILYALRILLSVLPDGRDDKPRPYTADAEYYFRCAYDSLTTSKDKPIAILSGHTSYTRGISCSQDGKYIATCSNDKYVIVWDANTAKKIISIPAHKELVSSVNFSSDGKFIVSSSYDGTAKIWDINTGKLIREIGNLNNADGNAWFATFDRKGDKLAVSYDNSITMYDLRNQKEERFPIQGHCPIAFSKDGKEIAFATENSVSIINLSNGNIKTVYDEKNLQKKNRYFYDIKYSFDGKYLLVCGYGIMVFSTESYEIVREFPNHGYYYCVDISKDNRFVLGSGHSNRHNGMDDSASGDFNSSIDVCTIWDIESGEILCEHPGMLYAAFGYNNYRVYSTFDNYVYTWNFMGLDSLKHTIDTSTFLPRNIDKQQESKVTLKDSRVIVRDNAGGVLLELKDRKYYNAMITTDGKYLICCSDDDYYDESIWVWDLQRLNLVKTMRGFHSSISLQLNNNYLMASTNNETKHIIYETQTFEKIYEFKDVEKPMFYEDRIYFPKSKNYIEFFTLDVLMSKCKNILIDWELTDEEKKELHLY